MNQDQLKIKLDEYSDNKDFIVIYSGKMSKKFDGLYHPEKQEIIIHNKNFTDVNELFYTALHELAHHIDFTQNRGKTTRNAHGGKFRSIFHGLIEKAISNGDYEEYDNQFVQAAVDINKEHTKFLKRFGKILIALLDKCQQDHRGFEDIVDRKLSLKKGELKAIMAVYAMDISEDIGGHFAEKVTKIKDPIKRKEAEVKGELPAPKPVLSKDQDELAYLEAQQRRIDKTIESLEKKRQAIADQIEGLENS